jgi:predicted nucleic acid-binding protein
VALVLDTGPLLAGLDAADVDHDRCARLIRHAEEDLVVPTLVLAELDYWCHQRLGVETWLTFLNDLIAGAYIAESPTPSDLTRCKEIQTRYRDQPIGIVDASVLALLERLGEQKLATLDHRHFTVVRPAHVKSLRLLP